MDPFCPPLHDGVVTWIEQLKSPEFIEINCEHSFIISSSGSSTPSPSSSKNKVYVLVKESFTHKFEITLESFDTIEPEQRIIFSKTPDGSVIGFGILQLVLISCILQVTLSELQRSSQETVISEWPSSTELSLLRSSPDVIGECLVPSFIV